jgi:8-oxo-dGTP diphosphatase
VVTKTAKAPEGYDPSAYPAVAVTVDMVVLTIADGALRVLLIQRGADPYAGDWALPGGFIRPDESLDAAAARELQEETGVRAAKYLEQFSTYGDPDRDPRMRIVTVAYLAAVPEVGPIRAGTDARHAELVPVDSVLGRRPSHHLAFDHRRILRDGVERCRSRLEHTTLATAFVGREFTIPELRAVYEAAWGQPLDQGNFRRKVLATNGFVLPTGRRALPGPEGGKPPDLYRAGAPTYLDPPLRRPNNA